jgi:glutaredoxin
VPVQATSETARAHLTVVQRPGCELCEEMLAELERLSLRVELPAIEVVDVDGDTELNRRYGLQVPVLLLDGTVVCRHRLDAPELLRLLSVRTAPRIECSPAQR